MQANKSWILCAHAWCVTRLQDNWPELPTVCSDLSPFYLQQARSNMQEWKRMRQPTKRLGGVDDTGVEYVQMAAERLDMPDASVDIVSVVCTCQCFPLFTCTRVFILTPSCVSHAPPCRLCVCTYSTSCQRLFDARQWQRCTGCSNQEVGAASVHALAPHVPQHCQASAVAHLPLLASCVCYMQVCVCSQTATSAETDQSLMTSHTASVSPNMDAMRPPPGLRPCYSALPACLRALPHMHHAFGSPLLTGLAELVTQCSVGTATMRLTDRVFLCVGVGVCVSFIHPPGDFNEPYYVNFVSCDFGAMFTEAGFQPQTKYMSSATKTLSFVKPGDASAPPADPNNN